MEKISPEEFDQEFEQEATFVTHEFCQPVVIYLGLWKGQRVALKRGRDLKREIEIMKKIGSHPNIVEFLGEIDGDILMEGIKDGLTLQKYCYLFSNHVALPIKTCIALMKQLASALKHLHDKGIIHHDLKDENVLVDLSGEIPILKLCDFGISEVVNDNGRGHGKEEDRESGTYSSMAPEQNPGRTEPITTKIDVYAFGSICSGIILKGRNMDQILYCTPIVLNEFIQKCKKDNPDERPTMNGILNFLNYPDLDTSTDYKTMMTQIYNECQEKGVPVPEYVLEIYQKAISC